MASAYFPTDVRLVVSPELETQEYIGIARHVLFHALHIRESGGAMPIAVKERLPNGVTISAFLFGLSKIVTISVPKQAVQEEKPEREEPAVTSRKRDEVVMLSGWINGGREVTVGGKVALDSFKPTASCAKAYNLNPDFHKNTKLVTGGTSLRYVRASLYSGAMKRVVQAIMGLGIVSDSSPEYISGVPNANTRRSILVKYGFDWAKTHGVVKAGTKNHWLVEVSRENGVVAMPLPLFSVTTTAVYRKRAHRLGDVGTVRVLDEFGGIPSGESFPLNRTDLLAAIASGKVIELAPPSALTEFYTGKTALSYGQGWAFAESAQTAHNTCWGYEYSDIVSSKTGKIKQVMFSEHWELAITLSAHDKSKLLIGQPIGTGSASLSRHSKGKLDPFYMQRVYGSYPGSIRSVPAFPTAPDKEKLEYLDERMWASNGKDLLPNTGWGGVLWVFFEGDSLRRVKWTPKRFLSWGLDVGIGTVPAADIAAARARGITNPKTIACIERDTNLEAPFYYSWTYSAATWSPNAFVVESLDMRKVDGIGGERDTRWWRVGCEPQPNGAFASNYIDKANYVEMPGGCYAIEGVYPNDVSSWAAGKLSSAYGSPSKPQDGNICDSTHTFFVASYTREGYMINFERRVQVYDTECERSSSLSDATEDRTFMYIVGRGNLETAVSSPKNYVAASSIKYSVGLVKNAGPKQEFVYTDNKWSADSSARPVASQVLPTILIGKPPEDVNWVGSV